MPIPSPTLEEVRSSRCAVITIKDAAALLGCNPRTVNAALSIHGGDIPARRVARRVVIPREPFLTWLLGEDATQAAEPTPETDVAAIVRTKLVELLGALESVA